MILGAVLCWPWGEIARQETLFRISLTTGLMRTVIARVAMVAFRYVLVVHTYSTVVFVREVNETLKSGGQPQDVMLSCSRQLPRPNMPLVCFPC